MAVINKNIKDAHHLCIITLRVTTMMNNISICLYYKLHSSLALTLTWFCSSIFENLKLNALPLLHDLICIEGSKLGQTYIPLWPSFCLSAYSYLLLLWGEQNKNIQGSVCSQSGYCKHSKYSHFLIFFLRLWTFQVHCSSFLFIHNIFSHCFFINYFVSLVVSYLCSSASLPSAAEKTTCLNWFPYNSLQFSLYIIASVLDFIAFLSTFSLFKKYIPL